MRVFWVVVSLLIALVLQSTAGDETNKQRRIGAKDFALIQKVISVVARTERKFDASRYDIVITEGDEEYFVTFEPIEWKTNDGYVDDLPGSALEVVVIKKGLVIQRSYWASSRQLELPGDPGCELGTGICPY